MLQSISFDFFPLLEIKLRLQAAVPKADFSLILLQEFLQTIPMFSNLDNWVHAHHKETDLQPSWCTTYTIFLDTVFQACTLPLNTEEGGQLHSDQPEKFR